MRRLPILFSMIVFAWMLHTTSVAHARPPGPSGEPTQARPRPRELHLFGIGSSSVDVRRVSRVYLGPRMGISVNGDQWILGAHIFFETHAIPGLGVELPILLGLGGNHLTVRPGLRLLYTFWIGGENGVGIYPTLGTSVLYYVPVGNFASFCNRTDLDGCGGSEVGIEFGGGLRYRGVRFDAVVGRLGVPIVTITVSYDFTIGSWS